MSNELHTMPLKIERLMSSRKVRMLELDEFGAYIKLLCDAWLDGGMLEQCTSNAQALQRLCGCDADTAERIKTNVMDVFFKQAENGHFYNDTLSEIYAETKVKSMGIREKAKVAAAARWANNPSKDDATSNAQAMHGQCTSNAYAMPTKAKAKTKRVCKVQTHAKLEILAKYKETLGDCADLMLTWWEQAEEVHGIPQSAVEMNIKKWSRFGSAKRQSLENSISGAKNQLWDPRTKDGNPPPEPTKPKNYCGGYN